MPRTNPLQIKLEYIFVFGICAAISCRLSEEHWTVNLKKEKDQCFVAFERCKWFNLYIKVFLVTGVAVIEWPAACCGG